MTSKVYLVYDGYEDVTDEGPRIFSTYEKAVEWICAWFNTDAELDLMDGDEKVTPENWEKYNSDFFEIYTSEIDPAPKTEPW